MPMTVLTLPSSIKNFDVNIYRCDNLTDVYCYATEPPSVKRPSSFSSETNITKGTLYVPKGCAESYWRAEGWRAFKNIKETLDIYNTFSVIVGEHGLVNYNNIENEDLVIKIIPEDGYSISSIAINDQLQNIPIDGVLKLGKITTHTKLEVNFEEKVTSIDDIFDNGEVSTIDVFNLQGILIRKNIKYHEFSNLSSGFYIVKKGNKSYKILQK